MPLHEDGQEVTYTCDAGFEFPLDTLETVDVTEPIPATLGKSKVLFEIQRNFNKRKNKKTIKTSRTNLDYLSFQ